MVETNKTINKLEPRKKITILIPAYNEAGNILPLLAELNQIIRYKDDYVDLSAYDWEYLFVNDGSTDQTLHLLYEQRDLDHRVNVVNLSRNFGKENAMLAGMDYATGDALVIIDADLQDPVSAIPEMVRWWQEGYEDIYGRRNSRGKESWIRKRLSLAFYDLLQGTTRIEILPNVGDFRLLDRRIVDAIRKLPETQRYTKGLYCWVGYNKKEILYDKRDRTQGKSSFNLRSLLNLAIDGITSYTTSPLRISSIVGFIISFGAFIYLLYIFIKTLIWGDAVSGFPTLICVILFLGGMQLLAIGIIGEYIGRIFNETKRRPPYIVDTYNGTKI